jgi:SulP family sulfate permease
MLIRLLDAGRSLLAGSFAAAGQQQERDMPIISTQMQGDLKGGAAAALLTIPLAIGFGLFAFAPLGPRYTQLAILAGLYGAIIVPAVALLLRSGAIAVFAPRSMASYLVSGVILHLLSVQGHYGIDSESRLVAIIFLIMVCAGVIQSLLGVLRLGDIVKYIPHPVIAGFQNGAALLLLLAQVNPILGLPRDVPHAQIFASLGQIQPLSLLVGVVSCALMMQGSRITKRIPAVMTGLFAGILLYYLLDAAGFGKQLGPVIGDLKFTLPDAHDTQGFLAALQDPAVYRMTPLILVWGASIALLSSLDALLCTKVMENVTRQTSDSNFNLIRLGIANAVACVFGSVFCAVSLTSSQANYNSGGRTRWSIVWNCVFLFVAAYFLTDLIGLLPTPVVAGLLAMAAIRLFDPWTLQMLQQSLHRGGGSARSQSLAGDLAIIFVVTAFAVFADLMLAVGIGIAISIASFLVRMSRSIVRRGYLCDTTHSRKIREERVMAMLAKQGAKIGVFELEGALFFGTAERLVYQIELAVDGGVNYIILDLKRLTDVDSTGARLLLNVQDRLVRQGKFVALSALPDRQRIADYLRDIGVVAAFTKARIFADTDHAIEWAEDHLILTEMGGQDLGSEFPFHSLEVLQSLSPDELDVLKARLRRQNFAKGEHVFVEGAESKELYIIAHGSASVKIRLAGTEREARLVTFAPGTVFGEIALLDTEPRSATITADEPLTCYVLSASDFDELKASHPRIAIALLTNLGRELSNRLRRVNRIIYQLEV